MSSQMPHAWHPFTPYNKSRRISQFAYALGKTTTWRTTSRLCSATKAWKTGPGSS